MKTIIVLLLTVGSSHLAFAEKLKLSQFSSQGINVEVISIQTADGVKDKHLPRLFYALKTLHGLESCSGYNCPDELLRLGGVEISFSKNRVEMTDGNIKDYYDLNLYAYPESRLIVGQVITIEGKLARELARLRVHDGDLITCDTADECFIRYVK